MIALRRPRVEGLGLLNAEQTQISSAACSRKQLTILPLIQRLQPVHHGSIVAVRGGGEHRQQEPDIERPEALLLVPGDFGKAPTPELERFGRILVHHFW